jgi:hypothetical protein
LQQFHGRMTCFPPLLDVDPVSSRARGESLPRTPDDTASASRAPGAVFPAVGLWGRLHLIDTALQRQREQEYFR